MSHHPITDKLRRARGGLWGHLVKETYYAIGADLAADARFVKYKTGKLTPAAVYMLAKRHNLPVKTTFDFLEELPLTEGEPLARKDRISPAILPTGTGDRLMNGGVRVRDLAVAAEGLEATIFQG